MSFFKEIRYLVFVFWISLKLIDKMNVMAVKIANEKLYAANTNLTNILSWEWEITFVYIFWNLSTISFMDHSIRSLSDSFGLKLSTS